MNGPCDLLNQLFSFVMMAVTAFNAVVVMWLAHRRKMADIRQQRIALMVQHYLDYDPVTEKDPKLFERIVNGH